MHSRLLFFILFGLLFLFKITLSTSDISELNSCKKPKKLKFLFLNDTFHKEWKIPSFSLTPIYFSSSKNNRAKTYKTWIKHKFLLFIYYVHPYQRICDNLLFLLKKKKYVAVLTIQNNSLIKLWHHPYIWLVFLLITTLQLQYSLCAWECIM